VATLAPLKCAPGPEGAGAPSLAPDAASPVPVLSAGTRGRLCGSVAGCVDRGPGCPTRPAPGKCPASFLQPRSISPLPLLQARPVSTIQAASPLGASVTPSGQGSAASGPQSTAQINSDEVIGAGEAKPCRDAGPQSPSYVLNNLRLSPSDISCAKPSAMASRSKGR
jgi:hypothetical protein